MRASAGNQKYGLWNQIISLAGLILFIFPALVTAADWPQHMGPDRNGISSEEILTKWPPRGPAQLWKITSEEGWSSPVIKNGIAVLYHRIDDKDIVSARNLFSGEKIWETSWPAAYRDSFGFDNGPRATPLWHDSTIYTMSADGIIRALNQNDGSVRWEVNTDTRFGADKGFFGMASSPLYTGSGILFCIGGKNGHGIISLHPEDGTLQWKATDDEAGYSSPVLANVAGRNIIVNFSRFGLNGLVPEDGSTLFRKKWRSRTSASVNAATPIVTDNRIFVTSSYDTGALMASWNGKILKEIWSGRNTISAHYASPISIGGAIYGIDGRVDFPGDLTIRCLSASDGSIQWSEKLRTGASIISAANAGLIQLDDGELWLVNWNRDSLEILAKAQVQTGLTRAIPALSQGILLVKSSKSLVALDLRTKIDQ